MEWDNQRTSVSSTPNSITSQSSSMNSQRTDKVPTLQQLSPSPSVSALSKLSDDDLRRKGLEDLLRILRRVESDYKSLLGDHGNIVKDVNRRYQIFVLESRGLKEVNQKLQDDNQELRDLCCFLDDDRQRGRKLAREWQRFGRYTASVMRSEVAVYQEKLHELEERQCELVKENVELKELCLFLDQERGRGSGDRDEGDGSSNGTVTGQEDAVIPMDTSGPSVQTSTYNSSGTHSTGSTNYIRELEHKVQKLEEEKRLLARKINRNSAEGLDESNHIKRDDQLMHGSDGTKSPNPRKPEAVVHAMKVLHIHEDLEKTPTEDENLDDTEKAIVREMCNVVWRKLGDNGEVVSFNDSSDSILDPPTIPSSASSQLVNLASQGQSHSFTISQPQPQMASTPMTSNTKSVSSDQAHGNNQKYNPGERPAKAQAPLRPSQVSNQNPHHQMMLPHHTDVIAGRKPPTTDTLNAKTHPSDDHVKGDPDKLMRAYPFSMPQPFPRPSSQPQPQDFKPIPPQPSSQLSPSTEENLPPHFQSHRQRRMQQQQPQVSQQHPQYFHPHNPLNAPRKSHSPVGSKPLPHQAPGTRTDTPSSMPASVPYHSNPPYQHPPQLTSSQQYPHHPVRLLEAPGGSQSQRGLDSRVSRDDEAQMNKPIGLRQESNLARKEAAMSEPNVSTNHGGYRGGRDMTNDDRETSASHMALRRSGTDVERKTGLPAMKPHRDQAMGIAPGQHLASHREPAPNQPNDKPGNPYPQSSHGSFLAYPRSGPPMSVQTSVPLHSRTNSSSNPGGNTRLGYSQSQPQQGNAYSRTAPSAKPDGPKMFQQQEWRQTYLDDSDTL